MKNSVNSKLKSFETILPPDGIITIGSEDSPIGNIEVMLDSGAQSSVAKEGALSTKEFFGRPKTMTGFCGARQQSKGTAIVRMEIDSNKFEWPVQVFETLGTTRADIILGRDFLTDRVIMDWLHGKVTFVMTKAKRSNSTDEEMLYMFCETDEMNKIQESYPDTVAIKTNVKYVEIVRHSYEKFPVRNLPGLEHKKQLRSTLHAVMSM